VLGSHQEFPGEGRLGGAALQRFFGGDAHKIGIVVFLRNVGENKIPRNRVEPVRIAKIFAYRVIRKMPGAA
jgi:hypothetical protein